MPTPPPAGTPLPVRLGLLAAVAGLATAAYLLQPQIGPQGQAACGIVCFIGLVAAFSSNLRAVNKQTLVCGIALQFLLAVAVIHSDWVRGVFEVIGAGVKKLLDYSGRGGEFVFGNLARPGDQAAVYKDRFLFPFAWVALPPIIFVSGFFSVLYYFGVLQLLVKGMAKVMTFLMRTSGAETLSVSANVFMGQTEAPLIVRPFVPRMTQSELLALMASGMAHVSGGMMAVYIGYTAGYFGGEDGTKAAVAILTTCVMACPCSLYLAKLMLPETETPETLGTVRVEVEKKHVNPIDALAAGISDGLKLALNVAAMLIGFLAMIALLNGLLGGVKPLMTYVAEQPFQIRAGIAAGLAVLGGLAVSSAYSTAQAGRRPVWQVVVAGVLFLALVYVVNLLASDAPTSEIPVWWPDDLTLEHLLGWVFRPAAFLIGVPPDECGKVGSLLGIKLVANEHVAFLELTKNPQYADLSLRAKVLVVYALTGFANFSSVGIQLGGIGAMAENRRSDLARLGMRALFVGFTATLVNAAVAGLLTSMTNAPPMPHQ